MPRTKRKLTRREIEAQCYADIMRATDKAFRHESFFVCDVERVLAFAALTWRTTRVRIVASNETEVK